jgi:hypothetical protein
MAGVDEVRIDYYVTDSRFAMVCTNYDKGGGPGRTDRGCPHAFGRLTGGLTAAVPGEVLSELHES